MVGHEGFITVIPLWLAERMVSEGVWDSYKNNIVVSMFLPSNDRSDKTNS